VPVPYPLVPAASGSAELPADLLLDVAGVLGLAATHIIVGGGAP
jgi:hypothetical protein